MDDFDIIIGLEVHVQLETKTKLFCSCSTQFGQSPNSNVCPICLGMPGALPILNEYALELASRACLALHCHVSEYSRFDRKNYIYPDLPKGYQITQYYHPIARLGFLNVGNKYIRIRQAHLEEDAGKLLHGQGDDISSYVDMNRAGIPLLEIVSEPDISSPQEAYEYLVQLKQILQYSDVSKCNMQEGSLRCDANISLKHKGSATLGTKIEIKNLNSFNYIRKALEYEIHRQAQILRSGGILAQGTYMWMENKTELMRSKENADDYRYFPDPDLIPVILELGWVEKIRQQLPEMPQNRKVRLCSQYNISEEDARILVQDKHEADYFEECFRFFPYANEILHWIKGKIHNTLNENNQGMKDFRISPKNLTKLLSFVQTKEISLASARDIFDAMLVSQQPCDVLIHNKQKISDVTLLTEYCQTVIQRNPKFIASFIANPNVLNSAVGHVMRLTEGRADVEITRQILQDIFHRQSKNL